MKQNKNSLHICSLNCQGLGKADKIQRFNQWMKQQKCQICFLQETHFVNENIERTNKTLDTKGFHNFGSSNSKGVSILMSNQIDYSIIDQHKDNEGRIIILNIEIDKKNIYSRKCLCTKSSQGQKFVFQKT